MKFLKSLTIKNLLINKKRTIVTIIGIILSTALICAIAGMATSLQKSMIKKIVYETGDYHISFLGVPNEELKYIENNRLIDSYYVTSPLGYALIANDNDYKPYMYIAEYNKSALEKSGIKLVDGRMPEQANELLIPEHLYSYGFKYQIGDTISLNVGKRVTMDGYALDQSNPYFIYDEETGESNTNSEKIVNTKSIDYKIVGIMERVGYQLEDYNSPGFMAITYNDNIASNKQDIYVSLKDPKQVYQFACQLIATNDSEKDKCLNGKTYKQKFDANYNDELLRWSGAIRSDHTKSLLYGIVSFVIGIVVVSSVLVIRNSFSISITERYKQYGMLASIGATAKQILKSVLYEALILGLIGIPLGILLGMIADVLLVYIVNLIVKSVNLVDTGRLLWYSVPFMPIMISILISSLTILLSALIPAIKISRISPMEAIRNSNDIKINSKKLKSSKLIRKVFGIGGTIANKNLKRSKKKYRTTIISIVVSVVIFISLSSFVEYGFKTTEKYYENKNYTMMVYESHQDFIDNDKIIDEYLKIAKMDHVKAYAYAKGVSFQLPKEYASADYLNYLKMDTQSHNDSTKIYGSLLAVNDEEYARLIGNSKFTTEELENGVIILDKFIYYDNEAEEEKEIKHIDVKTGTALELEIVALEEGDTNDKVMINILGNGLTDDSLMADSGLYFVVSDSFVKAHPKVFKKYLLTSLYLDCDDTKDITKYIETVNKSNNDYHLEFYDYSEDIKQQNAIVLIISIFLYGFIAVIALIGVTNIFNVITTNMMLRSKEFAMLKAIGMTDKEFKGMIRLESVLYGLKSLIIGIIIGTLLSYGIYRLFSDGMINTSYVLPYKAIAISIIFVLLIVFMTMRYSFNKINKQNIIETIRNDNI